MELLETKKLGYPSVNSLCSMEATGGHREDIHLSTLHVPAVGAFNSGTPNFLAGVAGAQVGVSWSLPETHEGVAALQRVWQ